VNIFSILFIAITSYTIDRVLLPIKDYIVSNINKILLTVSILIFIIPIIMSVKFDWVIPQILVVYDCFFVMVLFIMLISRNEDKYDENKFVSNNSFKYYNTEEIEKRKNGGLTNKEIIDRKKHIRKKLKL